MNEKSLNDHARACNYRNRGGREMEIEHTTSDVKSCEALSILCKKVLSFQNELGSKAINDRIITLPSCFMKINLNKT